MEEERSSAVETGLKIQALAYRRLVNLGVLPDLSLEQDDDKLVCLPAHATAGYLNGYTFSRYLIALKILVVSQKTILKHRFRNGM